MQCLVISVAEGQLKKLYECIRNQRDIWQQRSLRESQDIDECAIQEDNAGKAGQLLTLCAYSANSSFVVKKLVLYSKYFVK